ncbi:MAG: cytochrome c [Candidatus Latescibacteria bacterium]|nr:cytochrome c [Candidatus Latescibacterota bacterium]MDP7449740.1 cytochrome c [Candidatus Latescibacterota bacterium]HJP29717.1 cytochrome c [Candidatus Latescibacterota bacterium]
MARVVTVLALICLLNLPAGGQDASAIERGEYIFRASGGCSCHTDVENEGAFMAGGRAVRTPFGSVYATNITADSETGIGTWRDADFIRAMRHGIGPDGTRFFPVFPFTAFTGMSDRDLLDLKAYLFSLPHAERENTVTDLPPPFGWRPLLGVWSWLYLEPGPYAPDPEREAEWNRGAYLATALGHCAECHTPRNVMGGLDIELAYAGTVEGPEGELAPNITPDPDTGIGRWTTADITWYLRTGLKPDGDDTQGLMAELIDNGYRHMTSSDLEAIAAYLKSLDPIVNRVVAEKPNH